MDSIWSLKQELRADKNNLNSSKSNYRQKAKSQIRARFYTEVFPHVS